MKILVILLLILHTSITRAQVTINDTSFDAGQEAFCVKTPVYTVFFQKKAGGISSLLDQDGRDWIGFKPVANEKYPTSAASSYRGIPNLVNDGEDAGTGHPGFSNCNSLQTGDSSLLVSSLDNKWRMKWDFFENYAVLNVVQADPVYPYWFLYEGIPGGMFDPERSFWGTDSILFSTAIPDYFGNTPITCHTRYIWFGSENTDWTFFLALPGIDDLTDLFGFLGDTGNPLSSEDGMLVFGFGRGLGARSLLTGSRRLIIGFRKGKMKTTEDQQKLKIYIETILAHYEKESL